ncbi:MAG: carbamoyltransferase HypF [Gammaproteobacteria bacterium]
MTSTPQHSAAEIVRRRFTVRGLVQGVGFRPFVYRLAADLGLRGWVGNSGEGVTVELQGDVAVLRVFETRLRDEAPPPARISAVDASAVPAEALPPPFFIAASQADRTRTAIAADTAVCDDCLGELFDPENRRYRYPFINCVHCGPRFTISRTLPFDRCNTSMAAFQPCPACQAEYQDPSSRRFHGQANACPDCGPQLYCHDGDGTPVAATDGVTATVAALRTGRIVALKGVGGFHLLCDARVREAVARLRTRKGREAKPFAVMAANAASLAPWVQCGTGPRGLLESAARPIVLLEKSVDCDAVFGGVAPDVASLGAMLPYTPLHYLLFHEAAGRPAGVRWLQQAQGLILVCTSANTGGEPLMTDDREALERLRGIADFFVTHDREITRRCDDSVVRADSAAPVYIRRSRGCVPQAIELPRSGPAVLATGGDLKNTFCISRGDQAYVSQHNGDLDNAAARRALEETLERWLTALAIEPQCVVHDRHPDFFSSRLARRFAAEHGLPCVAVQHHHAHIAAVTAERGVTGPVLGVALDGFGFGDDGGLWGGELLRVEGARFRRLGHLQDLALPGGDRAAREPWRMAASALYALGRGELIDRRFPYPAAGAVREMLARGVNAPLTSSAGRWFDAAAGLLGVAAHSSYEGQAAMQLEALALRHGPVSPCRDGYRLTPHGGIDLLPLLARLADEHHAGYGAALFHATLAAALGEWVIGAAQRESLRDVALNGGCFINSLLRRGLAAELRAAGLTVHQARQVPPNDGGLSLGQAWLGCIMMTEHDGGAT